MTEMPIPVHCRSGTFLCGGGSWEQKKRRMPHNGISVVSAGLPGAFAAGIRRPSDKI